MTHLDEATGPTSAAPEGLRARFLAWPRALRIAVAVPALVAIYVVARAVTYAVTMALTG